MSLFRSLVLVLLGAAAASVDRRARADSGVQLLYDASDACPLVSAFASAVRARGGDLEHPAATLAGKRLEVTLQPDGSGFVGRLVLSDTRPQPAAREVHGAACEETLRGLAVIAALILRQGREPAEAMPASATPNAPSVDPDRLTSIGQFATERVEVGPGQITFGHGFAASLESGAQWGILPGQALPRFDLTLTRTNFVTTPDGHSYLVGGWVPRVRWTLLAGAPYRSTDDSTSVLGIRASFGGCTSLRYDLSGFIVLGCAEFGVGVLGLDTKDATGKLIQKKSVAWSAAGLELETQYNLGRHFHFDLTAGLDGQLRFSAARPDGSEIFRSSTFGGHVLAGIGYHF